MTRWFCANCGWPCRHLLCRYCWRMALLAMLLQAMVSRLAVSLYEWAWR